MPNRGFLTAIAAIPVLALDDALPTIQERAKQQIARLPDYVCTQTVDRAVRRPGEPSPRAQDQLELEVTVIGGKEKFARAGGQKFDDRELRDFVQRGVISTGSYSLHVRHVFNPGSAEFKPRGEVNREGRKLLRFDYEVPWENSSYKLAVPPHESIVAFRGHLLADAETFDLAHLEVIADEIPRELGIDRTRSSIAFAPLETAGSTHLFPVRSEVLVAMIDGWEYLNKSKLGGCREYRTESQVSFAEPAASEPVPAKHPPQQVIPSGLRMDVQIDEEIDLRTATPGQTFRASLSEPLRSKDGAVHAPEGAKLTGRLVRIELFDAPMNRYEVGLELTTMEAAGAPVEIVAQLRDSGGGSGAIKQQKQFMPVFTKKRTNRFEVLARGSGRGQGTLYWDANQPRIRKGYRMTWTTGGEAELPPTSVPPASNRPE
jgi:hypothetical protein